MSINHGRIDPRLKIIHPAFFLLYMGKECWMYLCVYFIRIVEEGLMVIPNNTLFSLYSENKSSD